MRRVAWALAAGGALLLAVSRPFRVEVAGASMEPALRAGDWLLATRAGRRRRGAVVVVPDPRGGRSLVKRITAVPGDVLEGRTIDPGEVVVRGDNSAASTDSRTFGPIPLRSVEGIVRVRYRPRPGLVR